MSETTNWLDKVRSQTDKQQTENRKFLLSLKKKNPRKLDDVVHALHNESNILSNRY